MSAPRRSSSPLSSASPSPLQEPVADGGTNPASLTLGPAAAEADNEDGDIVGGSSPTTLTEPLTESELTEDDEDVEDEADEAEDADEADEADEADGVEADPIHDGNEQDDEGVDDDNDDGEDTDRRTGKDLRGKIGASASPSLTPPPPSDPPRSDALPSSPPNDDINDDDDGFDQEDEALDTAAADEEATREAGTEDAEVGDEADGDGDGGEGDDDAEADGDVTMRAEPEGVDDDASNDTIVNEMDVDLEEEANGDEQIADEEAEEAAETADSPPAAPQRSMGHTHSSHAPPPSAAAIRALFALEIKFAALRDRLYVERIEEAAREEQMILDGSHPALRQLNKTLESRRERLHEIASRHHEETVADLGVWRDVENKLSWSTWTDNRDQLHWEEFEHTWSKRRRLAREKNEIETPKVVKPVPRVDRPPKPFDWSVGAVPSKLSTDEALNDLALMDLRRQQQQQASRHASPAVYGNFGGPSTYPYQSAQHPASYLQSETGESEPRRHYMNAANRSRPAHAAPDNHGHSRPPAGSSQPSAPRKDVRAPLGAEVFGVPRRDPVIPHSNGGGKISNGVAQPRHTTNQPLLGLSLGANTTESKPKLLAGGSSASAAPSTSTPNDRANASSRFPGLADYLSGSATPPQNSFQHHLMASNSPATAQSSPTTSAKPPSGTASGNPPTTSLSSLARPSFAQPPQPQTASVPRS